MNFRDQTCFSFVFCLVFLEISSFVPWMLSEVSGKLVYADESMDSGINKRGKREESLNSHLYLCIVCL